MRVNVQSNIIISISTPGREKTLANGLKGLLDLNNVRIVNVKAPKAGTWRLRVRSTGAHTVRVTGVSHADFVVGFSKRPTKEMTSTTLRPIEGKYTVVFSPHRVEGGSVDSALD